MFKQTETSNKLLAGLPDCDIATLMPDLSPIDLPVRRQLEIRNQPIEHVYFLDSGLASMVASAGANRSVEVGIVGNEGMTGLPVVLGTDRGTHETFIQSAGSGWRIEADRLRTAIKTSDGLRSTLLLYAQALFSQTSSTALANGQFKIGERLSRWLLMASDRSHDSDVRLTHEFLSRMMGTRRAGITTALSDLQRSGFVAVGRGKIAILDRHGLEEASNGCYGVPEAEYRRLFASASVPGRPLANGSVIPRCAPHVQS